MEDYSRKVDTLLDAVNLCLQGIGRERSPTLDENDLDVAQALDTINNVSMLLQTNGEAGYWFNREDGWKATPDPYNGEVHVPNNVIAILQARSHYADLANQLTVRGTKIYDKATHAYDLRPYGDLSFMYLMHLNFDELPMAARLAIAWQARTLFVQDIEGDSNKLQTNERMAQSMRAQLEKAESTQARYNYGMNPAMQMFAAEAGGSQSMLPMVGRHGY